MKTNDKLASLRAGVAVALLLVIACFGAAIAFSVVVGGNTGPERPVATR